MSEFGFVRFLGIAIIVLAVTAPTSYCVIQKEKEAASIQKACIEKNGEWVISFGGGRCVISGLGQGRVR